jgi:beta-phosphoglucomutase|tara:strand:+ start:886 stop:1467 length:582 start_codon:yes stop_codon:yes gene_type:complete
MIKTIIFDFDGTLADCKQLHQDAFREAMQQLCPGSDYRDTDIEGRPTTEKIKIMHIMGYEFDGDKLNEIKQSITQDNLHKYVIYNDELYSEMLRLSKKYKLCLASNATDKFVHESLKILKIEDLFLKINTATAYPPKPDPITFLDCMKETSSSSPTTIIFEDSEVGIQGAKSVTSNVIEVIDVEDTINEMRKL